MVSHKKFPVAELLNRIDKTVRKLGTRDYLLVGQLIERLEGRPHAEWRAAVASLLACNEKQWSEIVGHIDCIAQSDVELPSEPGSAMQVSAVDAAQVRLGNTTPQNRLKVQFITLLRRSLDWFVSLNRVLLLFLLLASVTAGYFYFGVHAPVQGPGPIDNGRGADAVVVQPEASQIVELKPLVPVRADIPLTAPEEPWWLIGLLSCIAGALVLTGNRFLRVAELPGNRLVKSFENKRNAAGKQREELESELLKSGRRFSIEYYVPERLPVPKNQLADSATLLGRLYRTEGGQQLAAEPTVRGTVTAGGRFSPVMLPARSRMAVLLLIDEERGDHPWLRSFLRVVDYWQQQGVSFETYRFNRSPLHLRGSESEERHELGTVARRTQGMPLIVFSRALEPDALNHPRALWVNVMRAWPVISWVDPDPWPTERLSIARQQAIKALIASGLERFPMTGAGLLHAAQWLAGEGQKTAGHTASATLSVDVMRNKNQQIALEYWAAAAALVPDPPWDLLEEIRQNFSEINRVFKSPQDVAHLIEHARQSGVTDPEIRAGSVLNVTEDLQDQWLRQFRERPGSDSFEVRVRQLLFDLLGDKPPEDSLLKEWWAFKRNMHQSIIEPWRAPELLDDLVTKPLGDSVLRWLKSETDRSRDGVGRWSQSTVESLQRRLGEVSGVNWLELFTGNGKLWRPSRYVALAMLLLPIFSWLCSSLLATEQLKGLWKQRAGQLPATFYLALGENDVPQPPALLLPDMVKIDGGRFQMGSENGDDDEEPVHQVSIASFELSQTEITVAEYAECILKKGGCDEPETGDFCTWPGLDKAVKEVTLPVNCVSWHDATAYANFVSSWMPDARLPTEAEWEYAARDGGKRQEYPWGDEIPDQCQLAVTGACESNSVAAVCSKPTGNTSADICDLAGNLWEWVEDDYHGDYGQAPKDGSAWVDEPRGGIRVIRGGSFGVSPRDARVAYRDRVDPGLRFGVVGFRLARSLPSAL